MISLLGYTQREKVTPSPQRSLQSTEVFLKGHGYHTKEKV